MPHTTFARILQIVLAITVTLGLSSCAVYDRPYGPGYVRQVPPATGVVYYDYWYYPEAQVYFDVNRHIYFYFTNQHWVETRVLPTYWRSKLHSYVPIHSRYQRPYIENKDHSRKYPPRNRYEQRNDQRYRNDRYPNRYQEMPRTEPQRYREQDRYEQRNDQRYRNDRYPNRYQEMPLKEPPRASQPAQPQHERDNYRQPHSGSNVKSPVRQRYQETPRGNAINGVKGKLPIKEKAIDKKVDKNKKSKHAKDKDQQDDSDQNRRRRDDRN